MSMVKKQIIYDFISLLAFIEKGRLTWQLGKGTQKISLGHLFDPMS